MVSDKKLSGDPTRIAIIGTGWGARVQVPAFRAAGLKVVGIAGSDAEKTAAIGAELEVQPYATWRELLSSDAGLVTIVTPPSTHREMAIAALEAGKHVLCEKPTAMNAAEAAKMRSVAESRPEQLALIDHELRFLPSWIEARRRMPEIGRLRYVELRYAGPSRGDRKREWTWWSDANHGGGVWGAIGSHAVDAIRYLAGDVTAAQASLMTFVDERPYRQRTRTVTSDDFAQVNLRLDGGAFATLSMSVVAAADETTTITFHGEEGGLRLAGDELFVSRGRAPFDEAGSFEKAPALAGDSPGGAFGSGTYFLGRALAASLSDPGALAPAATFADGLAQQQVLDAARESHRSGGGWVDVAR